MMLGIVSTGETKNMLNFFEVSTGKNICIMKSDFIDAVHRLRLWREHQYEKHLNHDVEVLAADGKKYRGTLVSVDEDTFAIDTEVLVAVEGKKRKQKEIQTLTFAYDAVKYTKYDLKF